MHRKICSTDANAHEHPIRPQSMLQLVECVPNFSEGRDKDIIDAITGEMLSIDNVVLLDVDMGFDFNRTVVTIVGPPNMVLEAVIRGTKVALELIDMRQHSGEHDRMGAVDVVPFIPISGTTMEDCVQLSIQYAKRVSEELELPVYLYAESARSDERIRLPDIRRGEYEGLVDKLQDPKWAPDFGPAEFKPTMGITATGGRNILIAYNVNLNTSDKASAAKIAGKLRSSGVILRDQNGEKVVGADGKPERIPGKFEALQAAGWMYNENTAQVSMNLLDYSVTGLHSITEAIREESKLLGLEVTAGELVGLVPLQAMLDAGRFYSSEPESDDVFEIVQAAIRGLQLDVLDSFKSNERIIEWAAGVIE